MKKLNLPIEEINQLYLDGYSTIEISKIYNCSIQSINRRISSEKRNNIKELAGQTINKLFVVKRLDSKKNGSYENECICECGKKRNVTTHELLCGDVKCCGESKCIERNVDYTNRKKPLYRKIPDIKGNKNPRWAGFKDIPGKFWSTLKREAVSRNKEFNITIEYLQELWDRQNGKCAISGIQLELGQQPDRTASLDRINNKKGYIVGNVQWVHKMINMMKGVYSQDELIRICKIITEYNQ